LRRKTKHNDEPLPVTPKSLKPFLVFSLIVLLIVGVAIYEENRSSTSDPPGSNNVHRTGDSNSTATGNGKNATTPGSVVKPVTPTNVSGIVSFVQQPPLNQSLVITFTNSTTLTYATSLIYTQGVGSNYYWRYSLSVASNTTYFVSVHSPTLEWIPNIPQVTITGSTFYWQVECGPPETYG
jgi:hypothetical protein